MKIVFVADRPGKCLAGAWELINRRGHKALSLVRRNGRWRLTVLVGEK